MLAAVLTVAALWLGVLLWLSLRAWRYLAAAPQPAAVEISRGGGLVEVPAHYEPAAVERMQHMLEEVKKRPTTP